MRKRRRVTRSMKKNSSYASSYKPKLEEANCKPLAGARKSPASTGNRSGSRYTAGGMTQLARQAKKANSPITCNSQHQLEAYDNNATTRKNPVQVLLSKVASVKVNQQLTGEDIKGLKDNSHTQTHRAAMSLVQGWNNPLGLISPALVRGKLQAAWARLLVGHRSD